MFVEDEFLELKSELKKDIKKEIVAFANTNGGKIYIGVNDDGSIIGLKNIKEDIEALSGMIREGIKSDLTMYTKISEEKIDNKNVIIINIMSAPNKPYYLADKAKVYLNQLELGMLQGKDYRFNFGKVKIKNPISYTGEYETFNDGKIFQIGNIKIECIHCEGHTKGHSAYLVDDMYLFTGDSIAINENGGYCFFDFYNMDTKTSINSIKSMKEKLKTRKPKMVCTSHNGTCEFDEAFKNIEKVAKASKRKPFDINAPKDVFKK